MSDQFAKDHAPGNMTLTASNWPVVLDLPPELRQDWEDFLPSKLAYALHLCNAVPFDNSDNPVLRRGKRMERVGEDILRERGYEIRGTQVRVEHQSMKALTYLDVLAVPPGETAPRPIELKTVDERDYRTKWADGPPLYPRIQNQAQLSIANFGCASIGAIVLGYKSVDLILHDVERHEEIIASLEHHGQAFLDLLATKSPEELAVALVEEDSPDSYKAWSRIIQFPKLAPVPWDDPEAVKCAERLYQARLDKAAAEKAEAAELNRIAVRAPRGADILMLSNGWTITRTVVKTPEKEIPAHTRAARQHVTLKVKPAGEEAGDG